MPTAVHIKSYAGIIREKARRRGLAKLGKDFKQLAGKTKDGDKDLIADDVVGQALIKAEQLALDTATIAGIDTPHDTAAYTAYLRERPPLAKLGIVGLDNWPVFIGSGSVHLISGHTSNISV